MTTIIMRLHYLGGTKAWTEDWPTPQVPRVGETITVPDHDGPYRVHHIDWMFDERGLRFAYVILRQGRLTP